MRIHKPAITFEGPAETVNRGEDEPYNRKDISRDHNTFNDLRNHHARPEGARGPISEFGCRFTNRSQQIISAHAENIEQNAEWRYR